MRIRTTAAFLVASAVLTGCSGASTLDVQTHSGTTALVRGSDDSGMDALFAGTVTLGDRGCLGLVVDGSTEVVAVVWPKGSTLAGDGRSIEVRDVGTLQLGQAVEVGGGEVQVGDSDSYAAIPDECSQAGRVVESASVRVTG